MNRAVRPVPQHPVRQRHPQRLPRHRPAPGQQRPERPAGAVLAEDRADGLSSLNNVTVDGIFGSSTAAAVRRFQLLRPHQRRRRGPDDMEQALRSLQRHRQPPAFAQPAPASTRACCAGAHRHRRPGAAILPLPHERLPSSIPLFPLMAVSARPPRPPCGPISGSPG